MNASRIGLLAAAVVVGAGSYFAASRIDGLGRDVVIAQEATAPTVAAPAASPVPPVAGSLSDDQVTEIEGIIRNYLIAHPEVIRDAINELQRRQDEAERAEQVKAIADNNSTLFTSPRQVVLGNPDGDITLVEFFDYNCGYCKRAHADMDKLLAEDRNLRVVLKEFPVLGPGSVEAAQVSIAVKIVAPEKAADFYNELLMAPGQVNADKALAVAGDLGIDVARVKEAMASQEVKDTIGESYDLASKLSLTGTPSYVTVNEVVIGAVGYDALKAKIAEARAACAKTASC